MAVTFVKRSKGQLGPCWPTAQVLNFTPQATTTGILVFVASITGELVFVTGMEYGSGNFMDQAVEATNIGNAHVEAWTLTFPAPANPSTISLLADSPGLTGGIFCIVEFTGNEPDRDALVGVAAGSSGFADDLISTDWIAEHDQSLMLDSFSMLGTANTQPGAGQVKVYRVVSALGKSQGSYEPATGSGPAVWRIGGDNFRHFSHVVVELRPEIVNQDGSMDSQTGPATLTGVGDVEHDGSLDLGIGNPASFTGTGTIERNGAMDAQTAPAGLTGTGTVDRNGTMRRRTEPATFIGAGNNNLDHYGSMRTRTAPATFTGLGDVEHTGSLDLGVGNPASFTGIGDTDKSGNMSSQAAPAGFTGVGDVERSGAMDRRTNPAVLNGIGDVEHAGSMDVQTSPATFLGTGNKGSVLPGFGGASRNFIVLIDSQFTGLRALIRKSGASSSIFIPSNGNSVIVRKLK